MTTSCARGSCDSLSEVEERHGDPAQSLDAATLLPLLLRSSRRRQGAGIQGDGQLRLSRQLVDLHRETHPAGGERGERGVTLQLCPGEAVMSH